jgi:hypothetical protein
MPAPLARAAQVRADRLADVADTQRALREANVKIETGVIEDRADYAAARDQGRDDPGPVNERAARQEVADCERRLAGEKLRLAAAEEALTAAVHEQIDGWAERLTKQWGKADQASRAALAKLEEAEARRTEVRVIANWVAAVQRSGNLNERQRVVSDETSLGDARSAGAQLHAGELLTVLGTYLEATTADRFAAGSARRAEVRERAARLERLRLHDDPAVPAAAVEVEPSGALTLEEAEAVAAGVPSEEVQERARRRRAEERPQPTAWG